jgi:hypothetical protein
MSRHRRIIAVAGFAAALGLLLVAPALSSAGLLSDLGGKVHQTLSGVSGSGGSGGSPTTQGGPPTQGVPPDYTPPLHGVNSHGQGTVATVDLPQSTGLPLPDEFDGPELIVVGRARGEKNCDAQGQNCTFHGQNTLVSIAGNQVIGNETNEGEQAHGPLDPLQQQLLNQICAQSGNSVCLTLLAMDSATTDTGSDNHFQLAGVFIGAAGTPLIAASVAESNGNIHDNNATGCQEAHGDSLVAGGEEFPVTVGPLTAAAVDSSTDSEACNDTTTSHTEDGNVIDLGGTGIPVPAAGCDNTPNPGTPNTNFVSFAPLLSAVCNAQDTSDTGSQTDAPYNVREGLVLFVLSGLPMANSALIKATTGASEAHAIPPADQPAPSCTTDPSLCPPPDCETDPNAAGCPPPEDCSVFGTCENDDDDDDDDNDNGAAANAARAGAGTLPFTGANVLLITLMGIGLVSGGLALRNGLLGRDESTE